MPSRPAWTRRTFLHAAGSGVALACGLGPGGGDPRLSARPGSVAPGLSAGTHRADVGNTSLVLYLPETALARPGVPLMVFLHGALRTVETFVDGHKPFADRHGVAVVAPYAVDGTWDAIRGDFGRDVSALDRCLAWVFERLPVPADRLSLSGFSDGGTYALGLGRANGDLFGHLAAYSPGFLLDVTPVGRPPVLISHGTADTVLPYQASSEVIVPTLRSAGYEVEFLTFDGGHAVLGTAVDAALARLGA